MTAKPGDTIRHRQKRLGQPERRGKIVEILGDQAHPRFRSDGMMVTRPCSFPVPTSASRAAARRAPGVPKQLSRDSVGVDNWLRWLQPWTKAQCKHAGSPGQTGDLSAVASHRRASSGTLMAFGFKVCVPFKPRQRSPKRTVATFFGSTSSQCSLRICPSDRPTVVKARWEASRSRSRCERRLGVVPRR